MTQPTVAQQPTVDAIESVARRLLADGVVLLATVSVGRYTPAVRTVETPAFVVLNLQGAPLAYAHDPFEAACLVVRLDADTADAKAERAALARAPITIDRDHIAAAKASLARIASTASEWNKLTQADYWVRHQRNHPKPWTPLHELAANVTPAEFAARRAGAAGNDRLQMDFFANDVGRDGEGEGEMFSHVESGLVEDLHRGQFAKSTNLCRLLLESTRPETELHAALARRFAAHAPAPIPTPATQGRAIPPIPQPIGRARIYVCHPYSADPQGNAAKVAAICRAIVAEGNLPIAPQVYLGAFVDDMTERDTAMGLCLEMMRWCDEVRIYGPTLSPGMLDELRFAMAGGMRIVHVHPDDTTAAT